MHKAVRILRRIGNSQGIIIPKEMMDALGWNVGDNVLMNVEDGELRIEYTRTAGKARYWNIAEDDE